MVKFLHAVLASVHVAFGVFLLLRTQPVGNGTLPEA